MLKRIVYWWRTARREGSSAIGVCGRCLAVRRLPINTRKHHLVCLECAEWEEIL